MNLLLKRNINLALNSMRVSRSRSFFTMLGVIIAVASVTTIVSIGDGIKSQVVDQANQYSKNVITIRPTQIGNTGGTLSALSGGLTSSLTSKDEAVIDKVPQVSTSVPLTIVGTSAVGDSRFNGAIFAVSSDLPTVLNQDLAFGTFFSSKESSDNLAILGATVADKMFNERVPLGRAFYIHGQQFIVSGVLSKFAATPFTSSANFNNAVFVPDSSTKLLAPNGASVYEILAKIDSSSNVAKADKSIKMALTKTHGTSSDVGVYTASELANQTTGAFTLLTYLTVAAAIVTLIVSGVGIMNVMLVSVTERMHEIGIRKAIGATNRQIRNQFLTEATALCVVGSVLGVAVSLIACFLLHAFSTLTPQFDWAVAGIACVLTSLLGMLFGTVPAAKAARKDPIAALRSE